MEITSISVVIERIYRYQWRSNYLKYNRLFTISFSLFFFFFFFFRFLVSTWNFQSSETKMSLICQEFLNLLTLKDMLFEMHNRASFWKPLGSERVNASQTHLKYTEKYFYSTFFSFWDKLIEKKLFSISCETLGLLGNTLTANCKHSRSNRENLPLPLQSKWSKKR